MINKECIICKKIIIDKPSHLKFRKTCSKVCEAKYFSIERSGNKSWSYKDGGIKVCVLCGKKYKDYRKSSRYCSRGCSDKRVITEEHRKKISIANKGRKPYEMTDAIRKHMSDALIGKFVGDKSSNWKDGVSPQYKIKNAPRPKPKHCEVCGSIGIMCYDHDHKTGKFRGWLCSNCNTALGHIKDNPETLTSLANYLKLNQV